MDWKQAIRDERAMLESIVALLLALAGLAERAARHSRAAACLMLFILRPAATAASSLGDDLPELVLADRADPRAELIHLALRLRTLAYLVECEAELSFASCPKMQRPSRVTRQKVGTTLTRAMTAFDFTRSVYAPDTS